MFKPLMSGMFNAVAVNRKLRQIWAAIDEIKEFQEPEQAVEVSTEAPETVSEDSAETVVQEVDLEEFDSNALKAWAWDTHALKITGNKKADTIRAEIKEFLSEGD